MPTVETVNGPIDVEELGLTLIHEHFRTIDEAGRVQFPHLYDEQAEWDVAIADANAVKGHSIRTVVEPSAMFLNRDPGAPQPGPGAGDHRALGFPRHPDGRAGARAGRRCLPGEGQLDARGAGDDPRGRRRPALERVAGHPGLEPGIAGFGDRCLSQFGQCPVARQS